MVDSPRLFVLQKLTSHLEEITIENGWDYPLAGAVFRGRPLFGEGDPIPMLSILEAPRSDVGLYAGSEGAARSEKWQLNLQGWAEDDKQHPTDPAYYLAAAVEKKLKEIIEEDKAGRPVYPVAYLLGGLISSFRFGPCVVRPPMEQVSSKAFFYLPVFIGLATNVG